MTCKHSGIVLDYSTGEVLIEQKVTVAGEIVVENTSIQYCPFCGIDLIRWAQRRVRKDLAELYVEQSRNSENFQLACQIEKYQILYEKLEKRKKLG